MAMLGLDALNTDSFDENDQDAGLAVGRPTEHRPLCPAVAGFVDIGVA